MGEVCRRCFKNDDSYMRKKIAIVRGKFLNQYEMQSFEPLQFQYDITAFASLRSFHDSFSFPTVKLLSPMDVKDFPYKMQIFNRVFVDAQYLFGLERELKGFDLAHSAETYYRYTQQCLNAKKKGYVKKVIATVLENIPFNNEGISGRKTFKLRARKELDHIIALTQRTKETLLLEGADERKITVIGHGVDVKRFHPKINVFKNKKRIHIMFAGRFEKYKGVYEILYAAKRLLKDQELKKYHLLFSFVGDGSEKDNLLTLERKLGIEKFVVHKHVSYENMPNEYETVDIFTAPSKADKYWQEQYNTTLLEAQASGLPIVTTHSGGIIENVGDAAILTQPDDFLSLSEGLKQFIISPELRIHYSQKARKRAEKIHDAQIIAKNISLVYEKVLEK